ncbi:hypothetical protein [Actinomadura parmotrematis]|uniref:Uncharacterized protein n=1 Tax=Actinomadura parmotrematis TaxID=2864039 RepID=A0ABS7FVC8_9ACTN|nr:hypothetical protein [Actinomadura parmotrematis]MBW8483915.1 hypothetical protein [Actinomadura parmotrematis]
MNEDERGAEAAAMLEELGELRRRTRARRRAFGVPLLVFAALVAGVLPVAAVAARHGGGPAGAAGGGDVLSGLAGGGPDGGAALGRYWAVVPVVGYLASALWYRWHARRAGAATPTRAFIAVGLTALAAVLALAVAAHWSVTMQRVWDWPRASLVLPALTVGLAVLARAERSRLLGASVAAFALLSAVALLAHPENLLYDAGLPATSDPWLLGVAATVAPPSLALLAGGAAALVRERRGARW